MLYRHIHYGKTIFTHSLDQWQRGVRDCLVLAPYLKGNVSHGFSEVVGLQAVPVVQVLPQKHSHFQRNLKKREHSKKWVTRVELKCRTEQPEGWRSHCLNSYTWALLASTLQTLETTLRRTGSLSCSEPSWLHPRFPGTINRSTNQSRCETGFSGGSAPVEPRRWQFIHSWKRVTETVQQVLLSSHLTESLAMLTKVLLNRMENWVMQLAENLWQPSDEAKSWDNNRVIMINKDNSTIKNTLKSKHN